MRTESGERERERERERRDRMGGVKEEWRDVERDGESEEFVS